MDTKVTSLKLADTRMLQDLSRISCSRSCFMVEKKEKEGKMDRLPTINVVCLKPYCHSLLYLVFLTTGQF